MVGSYLPVVFVLALFVLTVLINAPLHRLAPARALTSGELAVATAMMLVSCTIPTWGLMGILLPTLVAPFHFGVVDERFWSAFTAMDLPAWLFPVERIEDGPISSTVIGFYGRLQPDEPIPFAAWVMPLAVWGVYIGAMFTMLIGLMAIVRPQWADNERLPFPLVQLQLSLIESPKHGRMLNDLLGSRSFWIALSVVFVLQSLSALHQYHPRYIPEVPLEYDLREIFANEPWVHFHTLVKANRIYFIFLGVTFFIQSRVGFSLWSIFLITQLVNVQQRMMQTEIPVNAWGEQHLGASIAFVIGIAWIGRRHWLMVLRQAVGMRRAGEPAGDFLSNRTSVLLVVGGMTVMLLWLVVVGMQWWFALASIAFVLLAQVVVARVVAETGLPFFRAHTTVGQVYPNFSPLHFTGKDIFFGQAAMLLGPATLREGLSPFALHALQSNEAAQLPPRQRPGLLALIAWALLLGFVVAAASSLWCYYRYATPITDKAERAVINPWGMESIQGGHIVRPLQAHMDQRFVPKPYNSWLHMGTGALVGGFLQFASLRWAWWPFMPVGYLVALTWYAQAAWFSILLGWLCKVLIVQYGGAKMFQQARPFFVGLIFGEALAAGVWLVITIILAQTGYDYEIFRLLPGG
jgi:hypothetical protein